MSSMKKIKKILPQYIEEQVLDYLAPGYTDFLCQLRQNSENAIKFSYMKGTEYPDFPKELPLRIESAHIITTNIPATQDPSSSAPPDFNLAIAISGNKIFIGSPNTGFRQCSGGLNDTKHRLVTAAQKAYYLPAAPHQNTHVKELTSKQLNR